MNNLYTSVDIIGGLGNQLFQIAYIIYFLRLSKKNKIKRKLVFKYADDVGDEINILSNIPRKTYWNTLFKGLFRVLNADDFKNIPLNILHCEKTPHTFVEPPCNDKYNILFKGGYQTFKHIDDTLREKMISIVYSNEDIMYPAYYKYRDILDYFGNNTKDDDMVSLHIRRTDYLSLSNYNYNLDMSYYKEALQIANKKKVVVFSDDIEWCIDNFNDYANRENIYDVYYVSTKIFKEDELGIKEDIEFILMSMFKNNIIANSYFSLWASFISYYKSKIIIAPKRWYSCDGCKNYEEVYHKYITHMI
jgi:hypothetical protein